MSVPRLSRRPEPIPGESLASYLDRLAAQHAVPLGTMLEHIGLRVPGEQRPEGYGVTLTAARKSSLASATGLDIEVIERMLLTALPGGERLAALHRGWALTASSKLWLSPGGSRACPHCLREERGAWALSWKSYLSVVCVRHQVLLLAQCPVCEGRLGQGVDERQTAPRLWSVLPRPGWCLGLAPERLRGDKIDGRRCPCDLRNLETRSVAGYERLLEAQAAIDEMLAGEPRLVAGRKLDAAQALRELRSACGLVLHAAKSEELGDTAPSVRAAFDAHTAGRERGTSIDGRNRFQLTLHGDVALMAAVIPAALHLLDAQDESELRLLSHKFAEYLHDTRARTTALSNMADRYGLTPLFERAVVEHLRWRRPIDSWSEARLRSPHGRQHWRFGVRHIPQLMWRHHFDKHFRAMLPSVRDMPARRFCSVALARYAFSMPWAAAAVALDLDGAKAEKSANHFMDRLDENDDLDRFMTALYETSRFLNRFHRVDYAARRAALADLRSIAQEQLPRAIKPAPSVRSEQACAAWIWSELTRGHLFDAPAFDKPLDRDQRKAVVWFLETRVVDDARDELRAYGERLLIERGAGGPLRARVVQAA